LSGGELAAAVVIDAVARLLPGVLGNEASSVNESFSAVDDNREASLLDWPQYTRPAEFRGWKVPEVLLSGHHEQIRRWRTRAAIEKMQRLRPDLLERMPAAAVKSEPEPGGRQGDPPDCAAGENRKEPVEAAERPGGRNSHE
jgi:tRNA (guanine37-N1)-methyltransferase